MVRLRSTKSGARWRPLLILLVAIVFGITAADAHAQADATSRSWNQPVEPFRIAANVYYVGGSDTASYLITTPKGHILIDSGFIETVPQIERNVAKLGFEMRDVRILLSSHAHFDHAGGMNQLKKVTGAKLYVSRDDVAAMSRGGRDDFAWGDKYAFERVIVDDVFEHGAVIRLGDVAMKAVVTPGHTRGCTTWTTRLPDGRRCSTSFSSAVSAFRDTTSLP